MIERLIDAALRNRLLVLVFMLGVAGWGVLSWRQLPVDSFPDVTPSMVQIFTASPGLSPEDVETLISYPVEISMYGLPGLKRVQSTSIFGLSRVNVYFSEDTDVYFARRLVMERLAKARAEIPGDLGEPQLGPITSGLGRVMMYTLETEPDSDISLTELRELQDWVVKPMMRTVPGVTGVLSLGGYEKQYQVRLDTRALLARDLTVADVRGAITANNKNVGASFINRAGEENVIRGYGWVPPGNAGLDAIRDIVIRAHESTPVTVGDVASVEYGPAIRRGAQIASGAESVGGYVLKLLGSNTSQVLKDANQKLEQINGALPDGVRVKAFYSQKELIDKAVGTVESALLQGAVLVILILYLLLGNLRSTLIVVASLPLSALFAFIAMRYVGLSANLMSLGGLAIGLGMMVDGSVVILENIFRHMENRAEENVSMARLASEAAREVARPIVFASSIIIIVFLPLFTLQGVEGKMFSPMAYTIAFALLGAMIVALVLVPALMTYAFKKDGNYGEPRLVGWLKDRYQPVLDKVMAWPKVVAGAAVLVLVLGVSVFPLLGSEFVPTLREGTLMVRSTLPPAASLDSAIGYAKRIQTVFEEFEPVTGTYSRVGRAEVGGDPEPVNVIATTITLKPLGQWSGDYDYEGLQSAMSDAVADRLPGLANNFSQPIQLRTDELLSGIKAQIAISIFGENFGELARIGEQVKRIAQATPGAVDVRMQQQGGKPQIRIRPDREAMARYGLSVDQLFATVETGIGGDAAGQVFEGIKRFDLFVRLREEQRDTVSAIEDLLIRTPAGAVIPLTRVADVERFIGPKMISRSKASRRLFVQLNVRGRDMGGVVTEIRRKVAEQVDMPTGYFVEYGGQFENQQRAMKRLYLVVPVTLALIFLLLYTAFNSLRYAALIYLNVPIATMGGIFALWLSGMYLSVSAAVGFIAVFGVAVLNGVVLVSYINQLRDEGMDVFEAARTGAMRRLRPVLMTALTSMLGLLPLLIADGIGANVQRPLAAVVVGGLITSTLLTLLVIPVVYPWFAGARRDDVEF
ncbi:MAG: efflux RND transporter permease subunit [Alcanivorax sp.]|jgi:cobalt-zinc-cadmium resistance protein CzcA|uniref:CzcA family heavy metal efflux pump n=1 Tax=Alloalcanivorax venustensis ISO4 TaxID=1177184 RepID=A0ABS0AD52_9GAMM|nr:CusA/CzcA family heavy metal efflux RND transporter [Alloalcanivorax venustensis]MBD3649783.1 efflux RND transporter permease subunit [Alcanivorax sp.]MEC8878882.1 CusA/CzcA family heavy metal efflux RND transporter [Pseudomonadota bacterium]SMO38458.1 cobalt-zinc-cadmium resistance protein CzcA [Alcanivorax sp. DSM 26295]MBF5051532.1 CzcA family heavy metal efflux pump [Alloalcanivorax venustensis ISO4]MTI53121.1 efflux RND transporter permease subunit [Alcanivorax sp.]|tara:strand:+ start:174677 stop:177784 length:3108 start_codon:yes stop_codon:yes gene_type:complete